MTQQMKVGLALSGGGAIGAYQVGVVKALAESGTQIHAVAGASIGALNGAIVASSPSLTQAAARLAEVWEHLGANSPLMANKSVYIKLLAQAAFAFGQTNVLGRAAQLVATLASKANVLPDGLSELADDALLSDQPLVQLMERYLDTAALANGLPLYVSLYPTQGGLVDILSCLRAEFGLGETAKSIFRHIQSMPIETQKEALLASAALPLLFKARSIDGVRYSDGGMGGWSTMQGNTPVTPLVEAGCNLIVVTHLSDGSMWDRHAFPDTTIMEIRPRSTLRRHDGTLGGAKDLLGFTASHVNSWIAQGYEDTLATVARIQAPLQARQALRDSYDALALSQAQDQAADDALASAMARIK